MNIVLLHSKISDQEIAQLFKEFPQILFLKVTDAMYKSLSKDDWSRIEVYYGSKITPKELEMAETLKWIHSPKPELIKSSLKEIRRKENILLTISEEENTHQIAEFVLAGVLAFTKNLFRWKEASSSPEHLWDSQWRDSMETLEGKTFLQIGLGNVGSEIAKAASALNLKVTGITTHKTFHPFCRQVLPFKELNEQLELADIISIALPRREQEVGLIKREELELMKDQSILSIIGLKTIIDENALVHVMENGKFRGVILDAYYQMPISPLSRLWSLPNILITPEVSTRPKSNDSESFRIFRFNLRQFIHGNFNDMRNLYPG